MSSRAEKPKSRRSKEAGRFVKPPSWPLLCSACQACFTSSRTPLPSLPPPLLCLYSVLCTPYHFGVPRTRFDFYAFPLRAWCLATSQPHLLFTFPSFPPSSYSRTEFLVTRFYLDDPHRHIYRFHFTTLKTNFSNH